MFAARLPLAAALLLGLAAPAAAHVAFEPAEVPAGAEAQVMLKVQHGCDGAATTQLRIMLPRPIADARPVAAKGWLVKAQAGSEGVEIELQNPAGAPADAVLEVPLALTLDPVPGGSEPVPVHVIQRCGDAEIAWIDAPADPHAGHDHDHGGHGDHGGHDHGTTAETHPAALLTVVAAQEQRSFTPASVGNIVLSEGYIHAPVSPNARTAAGFLTLVNNSASPLRLTAATAKGFRTVELHSMTMDNGTMRMRTLPDGVDLLPGQPVAFAAAGLHLMLIGPEAQPKPGDTVPVTLTFSDGSSLDTELAVRAR